MKDSDKYEHKEFDKAGEDETIITAFVKWDNCPKDPEEIKKAIEYIQNELIKAFVEEVDQFYGISPVKQSRELIQKSNLIASCICCKRWKIDEERTYLIGICQQNLKDISYDKICDQWEKI